jgi:hypothetical protein
MIKSLIIVLLTVGCLAAQAVPVCMAVTDDDARAVIGPTAKRTKDPSGCGWEDAGHKKQMNIARIGVASMFERARTGTAAEGRNQVETGLGGTAFSTIPTAHHGERAAIYVLGASSVLIVDIDGFAAGGAEERLPQMRILARKLVPKL